MERHGFALVNQAWSAIVPSARHQITQCWRTRRDSELGYFCLTGCGFQNYLILSSRSLQIARPEGNA
jgi:hypothetical protein